MFIFILFTDEMHDLMKLHAVNKPHWVPNFEQLRKCMFLTELPDRKILEDNFLSDMQTNYLNVSLSLF